MPDSDLTGWVSDSLPVHPHDDSYVLLTLLLLDDSSSIRNAGNTQPVIESVNAFLQTIGSADGDVRAAMMFLNKNANPVFQPAAKVPLLTGETFRPFGVTPLYARTIDALAVLAAEADRLVRAGFVVRTILYIFTDGCDEPPGMTQPDDVAKTVCKMLGTGIHTVGACALTDGMTDFVTVFRSMGIHENWIRVIKDGRGIRETMIDMGTIASNASRGAADFRNARATGFVQRGDAETKK